MSLDRRPQPEKFSLTGGAGQTLEGETIGTGRDLVLCHGLSATRRYVVHGSLYLPRHGLRLITYDARGHGESDPVVDGYHYRGLAEDLDQVIAHVSSSGSADRILLGGHSMGCHTVVSWALANPQRVGALILAGPVYNGHLETEADLERWDARADALEQGGPEGFAHEMAQGFSSREIRDRVYHLAHERVSLHKHPEAVVEALRELPHSRPFKELSELAGIDAPVLVVGTHDEIDPTHPLAVAESWTETIPGAELVVEAEGEPPLTWQGGRLSREIGSFLSGHGLTYG